VDPLFIEDTDEWLGCPTPLETCRQQLRLYENEFEELNRQLCEERADIQAGPDEHRDQQRP